MITKIIIICVMIIIAGSLASGLFFLFETQATPNALLKP
ncbi:hypothetical protein lpari_01397 [Legionella parisiensis]|uniref:Uncharacterized protein n=1 Tax=Legionella parisiensis TaxID=45071 RepID=A0A1E5JSV5_9GAMM|nr:hypothetical protein lpari_01397 [Legionella parisiensis]